MAVLVPRSVARLVQVKLAVDTLPALLHQAPQELATVATVRRVRVARYNEVVLDWTMKGGARRNTDATEGPQM